MSGAEVADFVELAGRLSVGRDPSCDIHIGGAATSREHAEISQQGERWTIRDVSSRNGIYVDGQRVQSSELQLGMVLRVGEGVGVVCAAATGTRPKFQQLAAGLWGGPTLAVIAEQARLAAASDLNIILEAESGTGKEVFARAIHDWTKRTGRLVAVNCAALPVGLAEAELFGYQRGAFTGADRAHDGYFRSAAEGTLFLDELLELAPDLQAKLLRAVERREVVPLGATKPLAADARIVVAAQTPLATAVARGVFRADLFARLNGVTIRIPPLRDRREDVLPLFKVCLQRHATTVPELEPAALEALCLHSWPLNVRELQTVAQRLLALYPGQSRISYRHLSSLLDHGLDVHEEEQGAGPDGAWRQLVDALVDKKGNVVKAAESLGISRQRAYRMLARHPGFDVSGLRRNQRCH